MQSILIAKMIISNKKEKEKYFDIFTLILPFLLKFYLSKINLHFFLSK